jgi:hypothetical protein
MGYCWIRVLASMDIRLCAVYSACQWFRVVWAWIGAPYQAGHVFGHGLACAHVGRAPVDLLQDRWFVGGEVHDAVADDDVEGFRLDPGLVEALDVA